MSSTKMEEKDGNEILMREGPPKEIINNGQREQIASALRPIASDSVRALISKLTDTHCHMFARLKRGESLCLPKELQAKGYVCVSTGQDDWEDYHEREKSSDVVLGMGVHPQCADEIELKSNDWYERLERYINLNKTCIIGEIGLDRNRRFKSTFETHQKKVFIMQLRLAAKLNRPVSVHSVKADGAIVELLENEVKEGHALPPKICIHSFAGSVETLKRIVRLVEGPLKTKRKSEVRRSPNHTFFFLLSPIRTLSRTHHQTSSNIQVRVYVGMNCWTNLWKKQARRFVNGVVKTIPNGISRFLLESDWHPLDFDFEGSIRFDVDKILLNGLIRISDMLDLSPDVMATHFESNTKEFLKTII